MDIKKLVDLIIAALRKLSRWDALIGILIVAYTVLFSWLTFSMYESFYYYDFDLAIFNQIMWNTIHDGFFHSSIIGGTTFFGHHMTPILIFFLPFYTLFQTPKFLLFCQSLFLGLAIIPIYLIAKKELNERWGIFFSLLYLLHPTITHMNIFEFHTDSFEPFLLLCSFYFYRERKYNSFLLFALLSMFCKEDVAATIFMFSLYGMARRFEKRYILLPAILSIGYFALVFFWLMPTIGGTYIHLGMRYSYIGGSIQELMRNVVTTPATLVRQILLKDNLFYVVTMLVLSGFLPLFSPEILLFTLPSLAENILSTSMVQVSFARQYSSIMTPFLLIASVFSIKRILGWSRSKSISFNLLRAFMILTLSASIISCILWNPLGSSQTRAKMLSVDEKDVAREKMLNAIPEDAPVMATFAFLPRLSNRANLYSYHWWYLNNWLNSSRINLDEGRVEYIIIDFDDYLLFSSNLIEKSSNSDAYQIRLLKDPSWGIVTLSHNIVLLKKYHKSEYTFADIYEMLLKDEVGKANYTAALWIASNTGKSDIFYATTISSYVKYVSEISERLFLNFQSDPVISRELSFIELPQNFGKEGFLETLQKHDVSYIYIFQKFGKSEVIIRGTDESTIFSKPDIIASQPNVFELVYENDFVRIYRIRYPHSSYRVFTSTWC